VHDRNCAERAYPHDERQTRIAETLFSGATFRTEMTIRPDSEPKYYLSQTAWKYVPLTPLQMSRVNSAIAEGEDPTIWVSPRQLEAYHYVTSHPDGAWNDVVDSNDLLSDWKALFRMIQAN